MLVANVRRARVDLQNCKVLTEEMKRLGYKVVSDGTDNHLLLVDLRHKGVDGARVEAVLERSSIAVNKNTVPGDKSAMVPGSIRMGSPALTTRGFLEKDFAQVAQFVHQGIQIAIKTKSELEKQGLKKVKLIYCFSTKLVSTKLGWIIYFG